MFYFIPLRTAEVSARRPWANYALMAVTVALTAFAWTGGDLDFARRVATYGLGGTSGLDLVSHNFLHANVWHLLANLVGLWVFGNAICARVGSAAYIPLYLALGAATGLVAKLFGTPLAIGASGTINALVGLAVVTSPRIRVTAVVGAFWHVRKVDLPSAWFVAVWVLIDVVGAFAFDDG
ncbi:MAG: rhomboid family intramembrane serine protease, partial [Myxococcales bacterium]|nr:rhomboid family intramembrane serine protease [Myxococcales bacterium]